MDLFSPLSQVPTVKGKILKSFKKLKIETIKDLLFYFPFRWEDYSLCLPISKIKPGIDLTIKGEIFSIENKRTPRQKKIITQALIKDQTGFLRIIWFNQPFLIRNLKKGDFIFLSGKAKFSYQGLQMINPEYEKVKNFPIHTARLIPIYSSTAGLTLRWFRFVVGRVLSLADRLKEFLPKQILVRQNLISLSQAIKNIHFPQNNDLLLKAKRRLGFDELFLIQLRNLILKKNWQKKQPKIIKFDQELTEKLIKSLPFLLTNAQKKAIWEILQDLENKKNRGPMNRLLEGEVGSGKTVVATIAFLNVVNRGFQVVFMAPTEILAQQHFKVISELLKDFKIKIALLTRTSQKIHPQLDQTPKKDLLKKISNGQINIIIGTHALIQEDVWFKNLGLAVIDEQHRFGVEQRAKIVSRQTINNNAPVCHLLSMSATPIPRTLALTLYGDLDISIIDEMPKERKKVVTKVVSPNQRKKAYDFVEKQIFQGRQGFVICPLIEESDFLGVKSVKEEYKKLSEKIFPHLKIAFLHGKMKAKEKEKIMEDFRENKINILVSTSVIEVGIDIPNANCMIIEGAERFGLAQLHQFRGRIRRGIHQPYCLLFSETGGEKSAKRLSLMEKIDNGFALAEKDLELRGPGELYGLKQSGLFDLKIASLTDSLLIKQTKQEVERLLEESPDLRKYPDLKERIREFSEKVHLE